MPCERDDLKPSRLKKRLVGHVRQMIGIDEDLGLQMEFKVSFIQKPRRDGAVARQLFRKTCIDGQLLLHLRDTHEPCACQAGHIIRGSVGLSPEIVRRQHVRLCGSAVLSHKAENGLYSSCLTISSRRAEHDKQAFERGVP